MSEAVRDHDFDLLERFQGVSAEFARLALLGIGAVDDLGKVRSKLFVFGGASLYVGPRTATFKNRLKGGHNGGSFVVANSLAKVNPGLGLI